MAFEKRDNSGALFVNDRKEKDNQPDRTGTAMIDGKDYKVFGWIKKGKAGTFLSLAFTPKEAGARDRAPEQAAFEPIVPADAYDDEIPF